MRVPIRLLLALAVLFPGAARHAGAAKKLKTAVTPRQAEPLLEQASAVIAEARGLMVKADPIRERLRAVNIELVEAVDRRDLDAIDPALARRQLIYESLPPLLDELKDKKTRLGELRRRYELTVITSFLTGAEGAQKGDAWPDMRSTEQQISNYVKRFENELRTAGIRFETLFADIQAIRREAKNREVSKGSELLIGLLLLVAAAMAAGMFLLWRTQRRIEATTRGGSLSPLASLGVEGSGDEAPGAVLAGGYRVERELGRGAMGVVYEATDLALQRKVAIKKMREELRTSPKDLRLFLCEARTVASFKHPNIVEIHSVVEEGGEIFLVFEHVDGSPLNELIEREGRLAYAEAVRMAGQIGSALDYAHERGVIHRDLKTANVMVTRDRAAKVMDFGIAYQAERTAAKLTRAETWGTPPYMAPEQELGKVSKETDLYALAVCLYEMATGELPFQGPGYLAQKREKLFVPPGARIAGLPARLDAVMAKALDPDPAARYRSAAEMLAAIKS